MNFIFNENPKCESLTDRILCHKKKEKESDSIAFPSIRNLKQMRVSSITNLKHASSDRFKSYINALVLKRLAKKERETRLIQNESEIYPYLNLQAKSVRYFEKDVKQPYVSQSISQTNIQHLKTEATNNYVARIPKLNFLLKKSESDLTTNKETFKRIKTLNQSDTSVIFEQPESQQLIFLKLKQRNYYIKQTINNWIKKANQINRNTQS